MVGWLEGFGSDRRIASRCADSLILRRFLSYALTEETPDHSYFTVFRKRLPQEGFQAAHEVVPEGLRTHRLLERRHPGIDSSVIEANASLSGLVQCNTEKSYWDYVKEFAQIFFIPVEMSMSPLPKIFGRADVFQKKAPVTLSCLSGVAGSLLR